jgi:hypothetical protein
VRVTVLQGDRLAATAAMAITFKLKRLRRDFEHRAEILGESFAVKIETYLKQGSRKAPPAHR